ncbi:hypothetical protein CTAYLR_004272 [Chrysophaeum taylorii]|uniref:tRNA/rRNA methyltransferase SpoU type domain-containing protein n=1 Tax=Chrysophaeum taylorii TaxID=2483200 RepID=A0AAD7XLV4_9STRA|nr:hypothetical protein CTAYLR_004272 [Chrysophaeum taylorii]
MPRIEAVGARLALALDRVSDPGNVGTLIRTAAAVGAAVVCVGGADPFSPKALRAAMGGTFRVPVVRADAWDAAAAALAEWNLKTIVADLHPDSVPYYAAGVDWDRSAVVVGGEVGLSADLEAVLDAPSRVYIPIAIESLNAAVAGSFLLLHAHHHQTSSTSSRSSSSSSSS